MADLGDVLRHVVGNLSPLSDVNREEFLDAVNAVYPPPEPPAPDPADVDQATELAAAKARVAELEARLGG